MNPIFKKIKEVLLFIIRKLKIDTYFKKLKYYNKIRHYYIVVLNIIRLTIWCLVVFSIVFGIGYIFYLTNIWIFYMYVFGFVSNLFIRLFNYYYYGDEDEEKYMIDGRNILLRMYEYFFENKREIILKKGREKDRRRKG